MYKRRLNRIIGGGTDILKPSDWRKEIKWERDRESHVQPSQRQPDCRSFGNNEKVYKVSLFFGNLFSEEVLSGPVMVNLRMEDNSTNSPRYSVWNLEKSRSFSNRLVYELRERSRVKGLSLREL